MFTRVSLIVAINVLTPPTPTPTTTTSISGWGARPAFQTTEKETQKKKKREEVGGAVRKRVVRNQKTGLTDLEGRHRGADCSGLCPCIFCGHRKPPPPPTPSLPASSFHPPPLAYKCFNVPVIKVKRRGHLCRAARRTVMRSKPPAQLR